MEPFAWTLHGIDEAGYGPRLGPLVQACASLRQREARPVDFDDWEQVAGLIAAAGERLRARGTRVGDSKALFSAARRAAGAKAASGMAAPDFSTPGSVHGAAQLWRAVLQVGGTRTLGNAGELPPWIRIEEEQHPGAEHPSAGLEVGALVAGEPAGSAAVGCAGDEAQEPLALHAICLYPRQFNQWADGRNKAEINWELTRRLVRAELARGRERETGAGDEPPRPTVWTLDRQGGRKKYGGLLSDLFAPAYVRIVMETGPLCVYRVQGAAVNAWVTVKVGGEAWSVGTAVASMAAKALREAAMARLNRYFCTRYPSVRPTAGYPVDADRWRAAIGAASEAGAAGEAVESWDHLWRCL